MKKSKIILVALAAIPLAACGGGKSQTKTAELSSGSIMSKELVLANSIRGYSTCVSAKTFDLPEGYNVADSSGYNFVLLEKDGAYSLYSLYAGKVIKSGITNTYFDSFGTGQNINYGEYMTVQEKESEKYLTYSISGVLIRSSKDFYSGSAKKEAKGVDVVCFENEDTSYLYDGATATPVEQTEVGKDYHICKDWENMEEYGNPEYDLYFEWENCQVDVRKGDKVSTYTTPFDYYPDFIAGDYMYYLIDYQLNDMNEDYQYEKDGVKHKQVITRFDYTTGKHEEVVLPYFIRDIGSLKDEKGLYKLGKADIIPINEDKTLASFYERLYIMDTDFRVYDDVSMFGFENTQVVEDGKEVYYLVNYDDDYSDIGAVAVFDEKLRVVNTFHNAKLTATNGVLLARDPHINGGANELYGMINYKGTTVVPFEFDEFINPQTSSGKVFAINATGACEIEFSSSSSTYKKTQKTDVVNIDKNISQASSYRREVVALTYSDGGFEFFDAKGTSLLKVTDANGTYTNVARPYYAFEKKGIAYYRYLDTAAKTHYVAVEFNSSLSIF